MLAEILKIHQSGRLDEAEQRYNDWLAQHPEDAEALNGLVDLENLCKHGVGCSLMGRRGLGKAL
jgi:hypothetical protein